jgi:hypothetical protein
MNLSVFVGPFKKIYTSYQLTEHGIIKTCDRVCNRYHSKV